MLAVDFKILPSKHWKLILTLESPIGLLEWDIFKKCTTITRIDIIYTKRVNASINPELLRLEILQAFNLNNVKFQKINQIKNLHPQPLTIWFYKQWNNYLFYFVHNLQNSPESWYSNYLKTLIC